ILPPLPNKKRVAKVRPFFFFRKQNVRTYDIQTAGSPSAAGVQHEREAWVILPTTKQDKDCPGTTPFDDSGRSHRVTIYFRCRNEVSLESDAAIPAGRSCLPGWLKA
ncbi:hypothetical protein, partial [Sedimenticola selenatireducens]|uniref:hypothetical protein n=1 Tax=Sedimenticola selenatireducens TaxID=191960 RepID=UPI001B804A71